MAASTGRQSQPKQQQWDVGNWNGETLIYSRTSKEEEQSSISDNNNVSNTLDGPSGGSNVNTVSELNTQHKSKSEFDPVEAARQIKNVIGIGQSQQTQQINASPPKPLMDIKPYMSHQSLAQQTKSNVIPSKSTGQNMNAKITPPPPQRIPHQPVIFSDRFDGGMHKIDVQFGNLGESFEDTSSTNVSVPKPSSSVFYQHTEPMSSTTKQNNTLSSIQISQRPMTTAGTMSHHSTEQSAFVSPSVRPNTSRPSDQQQQHQQQQQPVMNQQRVLPLQMQQQQQQQQPSMTMKQVVPQQYAVHHQQQQINAQNLLLQTLMYQQQQEVCLHRIYPMNNCH